MAYGKLNTDGTLSSASKQHEGFVSLELFEKKEDGSYYTYYKELDGKYVVDMAEEDKLVATTTKNSLISQTQETINSITSEYPQFEIDTFWIQEQEARAYVANNVAKTPFLDQLCTARGIAKVTMANKIIVNSDALKLATATLLGTYQAQI